MNIDVLTAVGGVVSTVVGSWFSFAKGKQKRRLENGNEIIKQYQGALLALRVEFEDRVERMQKEIDALKENICYVQSCKKRKI